MKKVRFLPAVLPGAAALALALVLASGCSIQKIAMKAVADAMSGDLGVSAFTGDEDIQLVGDALPFALKLYETILEQQPEHTGLLLTAGMGFISYANVFVQSPADMLPPDEYEKAGQMRARAKKLYLRGRDYLLRALKVMHPGFLDVLNNGTPEALQTALEEMGEADVPYLYWAAVGWFAAVSTDVFDMNMTLSAPKAVALVDRAYAVEPDFGKGLIHDFYISYYGSLPPGTIKDSDELAKEHFRKEVELTEGKNPAPYVALATTLMIQQQNVDEFLSLLHQALQIEPSADPDNAMAITFARRKAQWYLDHVEDFFLVSPGTKED